MAWYRTGTVTVTNGSPVVTGAGTDFVANGNPSDIFLGPDGRVYEVASIQSATQLTLASPYQNAGAGGQGFALAPTQSFAHDLALGVSQLLNSFAAVRDGIGVGLIPDGTLATPAIRFAADQDSGFRRVADNVLALVVGGVDALIAAGANVGIGTSAPAARLHVSAGDQAVARMRVQNTGSGGRAYDIVAGVTGSSNTGLSIYDIVNATTPLLLDGNGNMRVGTTATDGNYHRINKAGPEGQLIIAVGGSGAAETFFAKTVAGSGFSGADAALYIGKHSSTGRSINAGGTINAGGADYAEYMTKADGCGTIAKGDVCGVDRDGKLTRTWADAVSFVVKSTDPSYVGGDSWASHLSPRPEAPGAAPVEPIAPAAKAAHEAEVATHETALASWEADLEAARQTVDRIAFSGQVPVNVSGDFAVGDYLIAAANGGGIKAVAVSEVDITFDQYRRRLGKVWAVRDGHAWIDVQHG